MSFKRSFPPVVDSDTRLLILGSLPGEMSLARGEYYGHPQNRFWRLVGEVIGQDLVVMDYAARLASLLEHQIGLWDVVAQAQRVGSLDSNIRDHAHNDLVTLLDTLPVWRRLHSTAGQPPGSDSKRSANARPTIACCAFHRAVLPMRR